MFDARPPVSSLFEAFGLAAVVTLPDESPIDTSIVWLTPYQDALPASSEFRAIPGVKLMAIRRDEVPRTPLGTLIRCPEELGGTAIVWKIDGMEMVESDHHRVRVVRQS